MGQVALGFRSLLVKALVFVIMAALLAWALGGALWPRTLAYDAASVEFAGDVWFWRLEVHEDRKQRPVWKLMRQAPQQDKADAVDQRPFLEVAALLVNAETLLSAGLVSSLTGSGQAPRWVITERSVDGSSRERVMPDRLAVEQQIARWHAGLSIQGSDIINQQRDLVLDPPDGSTDEEQSEHLTSPD